MAPYVTAVITIAALLLPAVPAEFTKFYFVPDDTECVPNFGDHCHNNQVCAYDDETRRTYCCDAGSTGICWNNVQPCRDDSPDVQRSRCEGTYCCDAQESCLGNNLCGSNQENIFTALTPDQIKEAWSSSSSADPSASTWAFDVAALRATDASTSTETSVQTSTSESAVSSTSSTVQTTSSIPSTVQPTSSIPSTVQTTDPKPPPSGLSGGAIGGIVVGALAGLAIIATAAFFLGRRKRRANAIVGEDARASRPSEEKYPTQRSTRAAAPDGLSPTELDAHVAPRYTR